MTTKKRLIRQMMTFICGVTLVACGQAPTVQTSSEYEVMRITTSDKELQTTYSASIRGRQDIDIYPQVSGFLTKLCVEEGQAVRKGQVLFIIDQVPYRAALQTAEANVEAARASVATAQLTYDSKKELFAQNVISEFDLQTSYNNLLTAKAQLAQTENQLLDMTRRYGSRSKALEEMPAIGLILNDKSTYPSQGKIETISGVIDTSTGTVSLRAVFPNKEGLLQSGGAGNVVVPVQKRNCIVVPQAATYEVQDKVFVFKVVDGKAQSAPVEVTRVNGGKEYIVDKGLNVGDVIVAEGVGLLREGTPIQAKEKED